MLPKKAIKLAMKVQYLRQKCDEKDHQPKWLNPLNRDRTPCNLTMLGRARPVIGATWQMLWMNSCLAGEAVRAAHGREGRTFCGAHS